jgi:hypothetical protein
LHEHVANLARLQPAGRARKTKRACVFNWKANISVQANPEADVTDIQRKTMAQRNTATLGQQATHGTAREPRRVNAQNAVCGSSQRDWDKQKSHGDLLVVLLRVENDQPADLVLLQSESRRAKKSDD